VFDPAHTERDVYALYSQIDAPFGCAYEQANASKVFLECTEQIPPDFKRRRQGDA
jgi:hypothetical protein